MKHQPKYVKAAKQFLVHESLGTVKAKHGEKALQKQHWFYTKEEALAFYREN